MKIISPITLIFILQLIAAATSFITNDFQIKRGQKLVQLNGLYPVEIIRFEYICLKKICPSVVVHAIPEIYGSKINKIKFTATKDSTSEYSWEAEKYKYVGFNYDLFKVETGVEKVKDESFVLYVETVYLNRYVNFPESITLSEDQKFEYPDTQDIVAPYKMLENQVTYKFSKILNYNAKGEKKGVSSVVFKRLEVSRFGATIYHTVHGVNNEPQVMFSEVERVIEVSHWGNIAISQFYKLKNVGPSLSGEFSRIQFGSQNTFEAKNAFRGTQTKLPYEIWGLYYRDEVGNISTSRAYRDHHSNEVRFSLSPRYSLLGGWKCNWEIGYNLPTKGFLKHDGNQFSLSNIPIEYAFSNILTEKFITKIILPEGSSESDFLIQGFPVKAENIEEGLSFGYLDFDGRSSYKIQNIKGNFLGKQLEVKYHFEEIKILKKPLLIFGAIFSTLLIVIILKRMNLDTFTEHSKTN